ncbi:hypothetical protein ACIBBB_07895 [Streptomyces sp. NPDC051217]|uniref:hypothetical protein n=1 Tax=Streptomyces sp. NPDC051217 TaxID=3365644 RepID=UPI0037A84476
MLDPFRRGWIDPPTGKSHDIGERNIPSAIPDSRPADQHSLLGLTAFVQRNRPRYLRYARARLLDETASQAAVEATIAAIGGRWSDFLRNARPAADAWRQLRTRIQSVSRAADVTDPAVARLYGAFPPDTADTALLRWRLSMTTEAVADLMGIDPPAVAASLLTVQRHFPATALRQLEQTPSRP